MSDFEIEKDVQIPPKRGSSLDKYPFSRMEVNDSFFVKRRPSEKKVRLYSRMATATTDARKKLNHKFTMRQISENGVDGVRVWRIE